MSQPEIAMEVKAFDFVQFLIPESSFKVTITRAVCYVEDLSKAYPEQIVVRVWRTRDDER